MEIKLDEKGTQGFFGWLAGKFVDLYFPQLIQILKDYVEPDEMLNANELAEMLGTSTTKVTELYINQPGFPYVKTTDKMHKKFPRRAVWEWVHEHTQYK